MSHRLLLVLPLVLVAACGGGDPHPDAGATGVRPPPPVAPAPADTLDAGAGADADTPPPICNTIPLGGGAVAEVAATGAPPVPTGGVIPAGTYVLATRELFTEMADVGAAPSTSLVKRTIVVGPQTIELAESVTVSDPDGGAPVETTSNASESFALFDVVLSRSQACPAKGSIRNVSYSVSGSELWLFPSPERREIYKKD